jgi:hypothetical protein
MPHYVDRPASHIDLTRIDRAALIAIHQRLWGGFYQCPTTGRILECLPHDDKVVCHCGQSNLLYEWERTEVTHVHVVKYLRQMTVTDYIDQRLRDWGHRATK